MLDEYDIHKELGGKAVHERDDLSAVRRACINPKSWSTCIMHLLLTA